MDLKTLTADDKKNIVVLGGSYGGISTAHYLLKHAVPKLPDSKSYRVVLISKTSQTMCRPAVPRALISDAMFPQDKLFVSIPKNFSQYTAGSFVFEQGTATALDYEKRAVSVLLTKDGDSGAELTITYHALVIATGASTPSPLLGFTYDEVALKSSWRSFREALPKAKHIVIAGGGASGVECAGELGEHLNGRAGWLSSTLSNPKVQITLLSGGSRILPYLRPAIAQTAETYLAKVGVRTVHNTRVATVAPPGAGGEDVAANATLTLDNGETLQADLYIPATGALPNTDFVPAALRCPDGRVNTDAETLRVIEAGERVYAIGDASAAARPAIHNIISMVPVLGANINRDLLAVASTQQAQVAGEDRVFKEDTRETQLVPIGKSKGVGATMGMRLPSLLVWLIKGRDYWLWTTGNLWSGKQWTKES
ncbi:FAD/NAD(P)-binding domain-containing protein [Xylaria bambusicola]|uniref:FAD/NAD(P)-binding domain-containing protein n=1 Tax=Xylaria bambusicola TaxID=326684 RepID=UPI0020078E11|nr:FAD/NAD(P)-binding domain-containing protein [Xylaria bambusicola]KAI0503121.1 FAD/NAD(P)-binding domain-containing protein [Xylaria bambusicola]